MTDETKFAKAVVDEIFRRINEVIGKSVLRKILFTGCLEGFSLYDRLLPYHRGMDRYSREICLMPKCLFNRSTKISLMGRFDE